VKYGAVIFDLFGTLVGDIVGPPAMRVRESMAGAISVPTRDFNRMWSESRFPRNLGEFASIKDNITHICEELGVKVEEKDIERAAQIRQDLSREIMMKPREGAIDVLQQLKQMGIKTGLISNCDSDTPMIWPDTPFQSLFDMAVFSASCGFMKPDRQIFKKALDGLKFSPEHCLYVSNGRGGETQGAHEAGMLPVVVIPDIKEGFYIMSPGDDELIFAWKKGRIITSLKEVVELVE